MDELREKMTELIRNAHKKCKANITCSACPRYGHGSDCVYLLMADYLIANGVTVADGKGTDGPLTICQQCLHRDACLAWIGHGKALYDDFVFSVDGCPYFEDAVKVVEIDQFNKWIPVTERLPDKGKVVLALGKRHATSGMFQGTSKYDPKLWYWKGGTLKEVTHWMPLPEPPKGE